MKKRSQAYKEAGVDLEAASSLVERIKKLAESTHTKGVLTDIGLFGGMYKLDVNEAKRPVLVSSTDGVGTKLKLAFALGKHDTIGQDLVAMNVNDIIVHGARPLFFLDYFATSKLDVGQAEAVIKGIAKGCQLAECALLGGETAELPGFYAPGEYDLSGFCVGLVDDSKIVDGSGVGVGNKIIGLASSGLHSNGYSLVRKIVEQGAHDLSQPFADTRTLGEILLTPTRIYVKSIMNLLRDFDLKAIAHITGGGFYDNLPRILPQGVQAEIDFAAWPKPPIFEWLKAEGRLTWPEMLQVFNCGLGMVIVVDNAEAEDVLIRLQGLQEQGWIIGQINSHKNKGEEQVQITNIPL